MGLDQAGIAPQGRAVGGHGLALAAREPASSIPRLFCARADPGSIRTASLELRLRRVGAAGAPERAFPRLSWAGTNRADPQRLPVVVDGLVRPAGQGREGVAEADVAAREPGIDPQRRAR